MNNSFSSSSLQREISKPIHSKLFLNVFSFFFAISFIMNGYSSGLSGVSLGSVAFVLFIVLAIFTSKTLLSKEQISIVFFAFLLIVLSSFGFVFSDIKSLSSFFAGVLKFIVWFMMITLVCKGFYNTSILCKWLTRIGVILTIYILIQTVFFYVFHIYLPNIFNIGLLKPYDAGYADYTRLANVSVLRPASFLSESSFYGNYMICTLAVYIWVHLKKMGKKEWLISIFFSLGIVASTSTSAIVFLFLVWLMYLASNKSLKNALTFLVFFALLLLILFVLSKSTSFDNGFFNALRYAFNKFTYLDESSRFGKSYGYLSLLKGSQLFFGVGMGNDTFFIQQKLGEESVYLNSITSLIFQCGIVGLCIFVVFVTYVLWYSLKKKDALAVLLLVIYFVKGFAGSIYFSTYGILYMFIVVGRLMYSNRATNL